MTKADVNRLKHYWFGKKKVADKLYQDRIDRGYLIDTKTILAQEAARVAKDRFEDAEREYKYGKMPSINPSQPSRRIRKALKKYVKSQDVGLPTQYTPAQVRVDSKGEIDIKFARPPKGSVRNPKRFKVTRKR